MRLRAVTPHIRRMGIRRYVRAQTRYFFVILSSFRVSIFLFLAILLGGALTLRATYHEVDLSFAQALYATFGLMFFENSLPAFPEEIVPQILLFTIPFIGIALIAESLARFAVVLFNKRLRLEDWQMAVCETYRDHVIVCGLGRVGYRVVQHLLGNAPEIAVIERNAEAEFRHEIEERDVPVIIGDARKPDVLAKANVQRARTILILTDDDLANLETALAARELNPKIRCVLRMFNESLARQLGRAFDLGSAFSTSALAAPSFASAVFSERIIQTIQIDGKTIHMVKFEIEEGAPLVGRSIHDVHAELDVNFVLHKGDCKEDLLPAPEIVLKAGDTVMLLARLESIEALERLAAGKAKAQAPGQAQAPPEAKPQAQARAGA